MPMHPLLEEINSKMIRSGELLIRYLVLRGECSDLTLDKRTQEYIANLHDSLETYADTVGFLTNQLTGKPDNNDMVQLLRINAEYDAYIKALKSGVFQLSYIINRNS